MKVKYKDQVIEVCEGATFEVVGGDLVITPKEQEFKDGDTVFWESKSDSENNGIGIVKSNTNGAIDFYFDLVKQVGLLIYSAFVKETNVIARLATEKEKQNMFDALKSEGKMWNPETKQIEDILKVGDLAIFWDDKEKDAIISTIYEIDLFQPRPYTSACGEYYNAIKCTSLEQYINFKK